MGVDPGKLTFLVHLLSKHAGAIEADLFPDVDLTDLWSGDLSIRRVWILVRHRLLIERPDGFVPKSGTALARSVDGEIGDWSRLDRMVADAFKVDLPESKARREWKAAEQRRMKALQARRRESSDG